MADKSRVPIIRAKIKVAASRNKLSGLTSQGGAVGWAVFIAFCYIDRSFGISTGTDIA